MPKVGDKEFSYTPEGIEAAKQEEIISGQPLENTQEYETPSVPIDARDTKVTTEGFGENIGETPMTPVTPINPIYGKDEEL